MNCPNCETLTFLLKEIIGALPSRRDWLDPDLERLVRNTLVKLDHTETTKTHPPDCKCMSCTHRGL